MATIEHGFFDHDPSDEPREPWGEEEDTANGDPEYQPEPSDFIDWDWE